MTAETPPEQVKIKWVVIPAAGIGSRFESETPKQYLKIHNKTTIEYAMQAFYDLPHLQAMMVPLQEHDRHFGRLDIDNEKVKTCEGGPKRPDSVYNALRALKELGADADDWVLVHDAARPNLAAWELQKLCDEGVKHPHGAVLGYPVRDALKRCNDDGEIEETVPRAGLWHATTPQLFQIGPLTLAMENAKELGKSIPDESAAIGYLGMQPKIIVGSPANIKLTYPEDLQLLESFLQP